MNENPASLILCVDDDPDILKLLERYLKPAGYRLHFESDPVKGLTAAKGQKPALILVDLMMPQMSGYQFCERLQEDEDTAYIPVIFVTASTKQEDRQKALSSGAADYLEKPIKKEVLLSKIEACLNAGEKWSSLPFSTQNWAETISPAQYLGFREWLSQKFNITEDKKDFLDSLSSADIYLSSQAGALTASEIAKSMAEYLKLDYLPQINPEKIKLGVLPSAFSRRNEVVAISGQYNQLVFLVSNPFNLELLSLLENYDRGGKGVKLSITEPAKIKLLFESQIRSDDESSGETVSSQVITKRDRIEVTRLTQDQVEKYPVMHIANNILYSAVEERASDIHIEPKEENTLVRFRIDGDMRDMFKLKKKTGDMLISRFKAMGGLDIAERRKPQDGGLEAIISERNFKMRLATTSTPDGESLVIRMLEPSVKPAPLTELGMTSEQTGLMQDLASRSQGVVLMVGPTGSGKTTTIYSFLSQIDTKSRSLITVEDPVEYRIPYANQQQVNEKAGVTFEALLKSAVRQDPDIMFLGEIRDPYSAKMALDFASSGHLTISTIHSSNAISAVFRLERLAVGRDTIADAVLAIVAQRLIKKLCPYCKKVIPATAKEQEQLAPFLNVQVEQVAHPVGCDKCGQTGYYGREGIYEVLYFDADIAERVRSGRPLEEIRNFARDRGSFLIGQHAAQKVRDLIFSPEEAEARVLAEERSTISVQAAAPAPVSEKTEQIQPAYKRDETAAPRPDQAFILVADDDPDTKNLVQRLLEKHGCRVVSAGDGYDALMAVSNQRFDLIVSDIDMPNLDGLKLLDIINQKNILTPVMFLTGSSDEQVEVKALEMGAVEFVQKPFKPEALWARIKKLLSAKTIR